MENIAPENIIELITDKNYSGFKTGPLGHAVNAEGKIAHHKGIPLLHYDAPTLETVGKPNYPYLSKSGEVKFLSATGKRLGAGAGPRTGKSTVPLKVLFDSTVNNNNFQSVPEGATDAEKQTIRKANAALLLRFTLGAVPVKIGGSPATERQEKMTTDEMKAAAKAAGIKLNDLDALMSFMSNPANIHKTVEIPEVKPQETSLASLHAENPEAAWDAEPAAITAALIELGGRVRDAIRLVRDDKAED